MSLCPKSEVRLKTLLGDLHRMEEAQAIDPKRMMSPSPFVVGNTTVIPKTVTFDDSPDSTAQRRQQEEEKKDDDEGSIHTRTPRRMDSGRTFGAALEEASAGMLSPDSDEDAATPHRLSPFRVKHHHEEPSLVGASLIATPSPDKNDTLNASAYDFPISRNDVLDDFDAPDDTPSSSNLTIFQRNAIDLAEQESLRYTERIQEVEDLLEEKTEECDELKIQLDRSQAFVSELRADLVEQELVAKQQMQRLYQTFQIKLKEMAESFHHRADALDEKQEWAKSALERVLEDVDFTRHSYSYEENNSQEEVVSAMSSDASVTSNHGDMAGFESHLGFMASPLAVMTDPAMLPNHQSRDDWVTEKEELVREVENLKSELELTKAGSESLQEMLATKGDNRENDSLRRENAKLIQDIFELKNDMQSKATQFTAIQRQLVDAQVVANTSCLPKQQTKASRSFWPRSKTRHYKVKSPLKTPMTSPSKHLKDTISTLRSQIAVLEAKRMDLSAALNRVQSECKVHQMTASKLAKDLGKAKDELHLHKTKANESRALNDKITLLEEQLHIANDSNKMALQEKVQFRSQHDAKVDDLQQQLETEKAIVKQREESWKLSEQKCAELSERLLHFQELDKDAAALTAQLKHRCQELEHQKSLLENQKGAIERKMVDLGKCVDMEGSGPNSSDVLTIETLKGRLSHANQIESQLACTKFQRDELLKRLEEIAGRLLLVHPESTCRRASFASFLPEQISTLTANNETRRRVEIPVETLVQQTLRRVEELLNAEQEVDSMKEKLQDSKERASQLWSKCVRWETIYDQETKQLQNANVELQRLQTLAEKRNIQNTIQKSKTDFQKRRAAVLEANCRNQQTELENIASALFDG